jgi:hypothetical protein
LPELAGSSATPDRADHEIKGDEMTWAIEAPDIDDLTREALKLLRLEPDQLYAVLGCQLLASAPPTRAADIVEHLFDLRTANKLRKRNQWPPESECRTDERTDEIAMICNVLKADGDRFVDALREELRKGLHNNENVFSLADHVDESKMQILIMIVSAILRIPARFEAISATLAAMLCKSILKEVCR